MKKKYIYWTLRNNCSKKWEEKFNSLNWSISHNPIIDLKINDNFKLIEEITSNYSKIIISSPFAAESISNKINDKNIEFFTVGNHSASILKKNNLKVVYTANNSEDLSKYIKTFEDQKYLHLCSEKSNFGIWPEYVKSLPIYKPVLNKNFDVNQINMKSNSIIVFGSPSGVQEWYKKKIKIENSIIATMGETTKNQCNLYYNNSMIVPTNSSTHELCESIYKFLKDN